MTITKKEIVEMLNGARGIQKATNDELGEKISLEATLQIVNTFMVFNKIEQLHTTNERNH